MGQIVVASSPVLVTLEHNDVVIGTHTEDEWGTINIYEINKIYWTEVSGKTWTVNVGHPATGKTVEYTISPFDEDSINLPTPIRFPSWPLRISVSIIRA